MSISIDKNAFFRRMGRVYAAWKKAESNKEDGFGKADALVVAMGVDQEVIYCKTSSTLTWLYGYELTDTITVCTESAIYVLSSRKKIQILEPLKENQDENSNVPPVKLMVRDKNDKDKANFSSLIECIKSSKNGKSIGVYTKDKFSSELIDAWKKRVADEKFNQIDVSHQMALVMSVKDESEISLLQKASNGTADVFTKYLKEQLMDIIDRDKSVRHIKLSESIEKAMTDKRYVANLDTNQIESCYPPIIQSGGNYSLKFSVSCDKNNLHFGTIVCCMGVRYKSYCSNICRTFMINPSDEMKKNYEILLTVFEKVVDKLREGVKLCDVFEAACAYLKSEKQSLLEHFTKNVGFATGLEFRESSLVIGPKTTSIARKGQVYNLALGFSGLTNSAAKDKESKNYAFFIGDLVVVSEGAPATVLTRACKKKLKSISIFLKDADEEDNEGEEEVEEEQTALLGRGRRTTVLDSKLRQDNTSEEKRRQHQKELGNTLNAAARERLTNQKGAKVDNKVRKSLTSYKNPSLLPKETEIDEMKIFVDRKYETIIIPLYGMPVPFHISMVKNISTSVEGSYTYLRINFFHPGSNIGKGEGNFTNPEAIFVKEVTFRSTNKKEPGELSAPSSNLNTAYRLIKEVQKRFKTREAEEKEKEDLVKQDTLVVSTNKSNPKLKDVYIRPNIVQKRIHGTLEAHVNGFRYNSIRGDKVDILYGNIKHAFFQPPTGEMIVLLHFNLKNAIMFNKKKHVDVQFYTEVGEITTDLAKSRNMHDRDDLSSEQAERELRHRLTTAFKNFCEKVESLTRQKLEFDTPFRELGFHGAPFRSTVLLQPSSTCLVNLTEWPPFVVVLEEVELVHFERVQFHLKNFDMVFVFKDYSRKTVMINAIPMHMLDHVKEWLNSCDIRYSEGILSMNWTKLMKTILDDPEAFFEEGGWSFLNPESDDENDNEFDDSDEDEPFDPDGGESEGSVDESDSDEEYSSEASDESAEDSDEELGSSEESGKDWSDLEREAAEADREREVNGDHVPQKTFTKTSSSHKHKSKHSSPSKHKSSKSPHKDKRRESGGSSHKRSREYSGDRSHKRRK